MPDARTATTWAILGVGLVTTGPTRDAGGLASAASFLGWAAMPYLLAAFATRRLAGAEQASRLWLYVSAGLVSVTGGLLFQTLVATPDAPAAHVFPFLPALQLAGLAPCWLWAERLRSRAPR